MIVSDFNECYKKYTILIISIVLAIMEDTCNLVLGTGCTDCTC